MTHRHPVGRVGPTYFILVARDLIRGPATVGIGPIADRSPLPQESVQGAPFLLWEAAPAADSSTGSWQPQVGAKTYRELELAPT